MGEAAASAPTGLEWGGGEEVDSNSVVISMGAKDDGSRADTCIDVSREVKPVKASALGRPVEREGFARWVKVPIDVQVVRQSIGKEGCRVHVRSHGGVGEGAAVKRRLGGKIEISNQTRWVGALSEGRL